ncbi:MAG TPA: tripartite tricarboxylate transporter substrate binding protein [Xanthobacteraceae bacterium]|jgi:tripartite-type tricarboxylate transporter receptor subunit TctC|nr:tripartite tricarboxylate transporter substrate binding protein [Xanthobacteraceae bacterium]
MSLRPILLFAVAAACAGLGLIEAAAQSYPNRPIKLIVPFPAGGPPDTIARLVGSDISARLGQTVVIDNRAGGGATIGTRAVANAEADGYTLLFASTTSLSIGPALFKNLDYDPIKSFAPVASVSLGALVVSVNADVPAKTLPELVAYAKANPGKLHNGAGVASPPHIAWGLFTLATGTTIVFVPYRGMAQAMTDLVAGQIQMMIDGIGSLLPHIRDGKVRALAVTGTTRSADLPGVPTMIESGYPDYVLSFWTGILAPAGTPPDIVDKLNGAVVAGLRSPETKQNLAKFSVEPHITMPQEFSAFLAAEARKWADIVKKTNIKVE